MSWQLPLFSDIPAQFPSTRYQGSKAKLVDWIWEQIGRLNFKTVLDAFGGTGAVAYRLKQAGKSVVYNDLLRFNAYFGKALVENSCSRLAEDEITWILAKHQEIEYPHVIQDNFQDIYFSDEENAWIDQTITNIRQFSDPYKFELAFFALCQACIIKRPYNLFHRKNLYIRFAEVERSFGNKTTWDKPFDDWFRLFVQEANHAVFDNGEQNQALNLSALDVPGEYDLVYIDPPYTSRRGVAVDYLDFYHFLEGLTMYEEWEKHIDHRSKHRRLKPQPGEWTDKNRIYTAFDKLFNRFQKSVLVVSYRSDGIPTEAALVDLLKQYKSDVRIERFGRYQYVLSKNSGSEEALLLGR